MWEINLKKNRKIEKHFIGSMNDDYGTKPFSVILPKTSAFIRRYDGETKSMHILIKDDELYNELYRHNDISNKVDNSIQNFLHQTHQQ